MELRGIEPRSRVSQTRVFPLDRQPRTNVDPARLELAFRRCDRRVLPLNDGPEARKRFVRESDPSHSGDNRAATPVASRTKKAAPRTHKRSDLRSSFTCWDEPAAPSAARYRPESAPPPPEIRGISSSPGGDLPRAPEGAMSAAGDESSPDPARRSSRDSPSTHPAPTCGSPLLPAPASRSAATAA